MRRGWLQDAGPRRQDREGFVPGQAGVTGLVGPFCTGSPLSVGGLSAVNGIARVHDLQTSISYQGLAGLIVAVFVER